MSYAPPSRQQPMSHGPMPVFHQQAPRSVRTGYGAFGGNQPAPAAPNSLSPVAMASSHNSAGSTGPQRAQAQETYVIRSRPNMRTGFSILLAGALIGGVVGITARARQNAADAAFAHNAATDSAAVAAAAPPPPPPVVNLPPSQPATPPSQPSTASNNTIVVPPGGGVSIPAPGAKDSSSSKKGHVAFGGKPAGHAFGPKPAPAPEPSTSKEPTAKGGKEKEKGDGYTVASAENGKEAKEAAAREAREAKEKDAREAKASEPKESSSKGSSESKESKGTTKKGGGGKTDDADAVLKAAMGATANTL